MATLNFDANAVEPQAEFEPIPAGKYIACIVESEMKSTKNGKGSYLELTFEILEGQYKGRKVWARLNLVNNNETTVKIARAQLSAICRATGIMQPLDSLQLHNLPVLIKVKLKKRNDSDEMQNEVVGFEKKAEAVPPSPQANNPVPPWKR